jgi:hypothetical protein
VGCWFGAFLGQTTLAAAWTAFGPGPPIWRLPLSLIWVGVLFTAWELNIRENHNGADGAGGAMGICMLTQWLLLQVPFWVLVLAFRVRMAREDEVKSSIQPRLGQFSVGELIVAVTIIGVALCVARIAVPILAAGLDRIGEPPLYRFLSWVAIVTSPPLVLAALTPRRPVRATLLVLFLIGAIGVGTFWERSIMRLYGEDVPLPFGWMNTWTALWIRAFVLAARWSGWRLQ